MFLSILFKQHGACFSMSNVKMEAFDSIHYSWEALYAWQHKKQQLDKTCKFLMFVLMYIMLIYVLIALLFFLKSIQSLFCVFCMSVLDEARVPYGVCRLILSSFYFAETQLRILKTAKLNDHNCRCLKSSEWWSSTWVLQFVYFCLSGDIWHFGCELFIWVTVDSMSRK